MNSKENKYDEFNIIIQDIEKNPTVQKMNNFMQHYNTSCFEHCKNVSLYSYYICKKLKLDYTSAARAGMLHDLFLYDWRKRENDRTGLHAFSHPKTSLENSMKLFFLNKKEQDIILKHMWPVTIIPPKYIEGYIITLVDKYCALEECYKYYKHNHTLQKIYRYTYAFFLFFALKIF